MCWAAVEIVGLRESLQTPLVWALAEGVGDGGADLPCTPGLREHFWLVLLFQQLGDAPRHV